jgi:hypothetical protein
VLFILVVLMKVIIVHNYIPVWGLPDIVIYYLLVSLFGDIQLS